MTVELTAATDIRVGGAMSGPAVELLVALVGVSDAASLPATSCVAALIALLFTVGAAYSTVTTAPAGIGLVKFNNRLLPEPVTELMKVVAPSTSTVNMSVVGVVVESASL